MSVQDDEGLIKVHIPVGGGKRATRVRLPGDCMLMDARIGPWAPKKEYVRKDGYARPVKGSAGRVQVTLFFRLTEALDEPVERLFRVVHPWNVIDMHLQAGENRSLGTIAWINDANGNLAYEVIEMELYDKGSRVSDVKKMLVARGLNRLPFKNCIVERVNGCEVASSDLAIRIRATERPLINGIRQQKPKGPAKLQWELRYQKRRKHGGMVGWAYIGTDEDDAAGRIPASLVEWRTLNKFGMKIWLSANLLCVANPG